MNNSDSIRRECGPKIEASKSNGNYKTNNQHLENKKFCVPGEKISIANEYFEAGEGAYEFTDGIYSSIVGQLSLQEFPDQQLTVVSVKNPKDNTKPFVSPHLMAIVTCIVTSRTKKFCRCLITHVGNVPLDEGIRGIIRREYITDAQKDLQEIETSFGVGDTVLARIVGIGDGDFIMSTAEDGLGVATALSDAGYYMIPMGWRQMECPKTKKLYPRKVAKIIQEKNIDHWQCQRLSTNKSESQVSPSLTTTRTSSGDSD